MGYKKYSVIGHPIGHTMSPFIHERLFQISGVDVEYTKFDIAPQKLQEEFKIICRLNGFNVTIPHKQAIIPLLDELDESAELCGAVNTVSIGKKIIGYNTDKYGFTTALSRANINLSGNVLICGIGGASRAVAFAAAENGCKITFGIRKGSEDKAKTLCDEIHCHFNNIETEIISYDKISGEYDLAVNATPVGMYPNTEKSVLTEEQICRCKTIYDLIYNPEETELLRLAKKNGIKCDGGMSMLVLQAAKAHEIWYGAKFDSSQIDRIIKDASSELSVIFKGGDEA